MHITLHTDGGSRGNPGPAAAAFVLRDRHGKTLREAARFIGKATNNVAEYQALLHGLEAARDLKATRVSVLADSELMVRQVEGRYKVKAADLKPLHARAAALLEGFEAWDIQHVRREKNTRADELANAALDAGRDVEGLGSARRSDVAPPAEGQRSPTLPVWDAELLGRNGQCIAGCGTGNAYTFGGTTPDGFCVHAAAAVLAEGPLQWPANRRTGEARCGMCGLAIAMRRVGASR